MNEELEIILDMAKEAMQRALDHLDAELLKIRASRATPSMLDSVKVDYYGSMTPLNQVSNVNTPDAKTLTVQPWEKKMLEPIAQAITYANLGLNPQNNGELIIISVPPLTEERRRDLVKKSKSEAENAKVGIRNARKEANDAIRKLQKDGLAEDEAKAGEASIQQLTDDYTKRADAKAEQKEKDIMTI